jgi:hypothetical protein
LLDWCRTQWRDASFTNDCCGPSLLRWRRSRQTSFTGCEQPVRLICRTHPNIPRTSALADTRELCHLSLLPPKLLSWTSESSQMMQIVESSVNSLLTRAKMRLDELHGQPRVYRTILFRCHVSYNKDIIIRKVILTWSMFLNAENRHKRYQRSHR